ncbi:hypothetical protein [Listeria grandensis]|uniref:hypothetical protein n=1 Tax=Listeria grandensis TaxID=1494963 RepID=UPI00164D33C3|nr:hypothetical protein [Listeria grandensis]MBC6316892.1 hypothetical protein [Listeria grandensis]
MAKVPFQNTIANYKLLYDAQESLFPYTIFRMENNTPFSVLGNITTTTIGIIEEDGATIEYMGTHFGPLCKGFYFSIPGVFEFYGKAILLERTGYNGNLSMGHVHAKNPVSLDSLFSETSLILPRIAGTPTLNYITLTKGQIVELPQSSYIYVSSGEIQLRSPQHHTLLSPQDIHFIHGTELATIEVQSELGKCFLIQAF